MCDQQVMTKERAAEILRPEINRDYRTPIVFFNAIDYNAYDGDEITLDGSFTVEQLEAVVWWMRHGDL